MYALLLGLEWVEKTLIWSGLGHWSMYGVFNKLHILRWVKSLFYFGRKQEPIFMKPNKSIKAEDF